MKTPTISALTFILLLTFSCSSSADDHEDFLECLSEKFHNYSSISNLVYTPRSSSFSSILLSSTWNLRYTTASTPKPQVIITPEHESQIPTIIHCAEDNDMEIRTRSGGHDFEGRSFVSQVPFLIIDMIRLSQVTVNAEAKTAWVGAGATLSILYYSIAEKSPTLAFPAGFCPTVGIGGHLSGGGYGSLLRKYGLAADNIIDARIVDVKGRILNRKSMGEDLFWVIRGGGGGSFGVIVSFKIQLGRQIAFVDARKFSGVGFGSRRLYRNELDPICSSPIPAKGIEGIWRFFYEREGENSPLLMFPYGGRMAEISVSETPYPHRNNLFHMSNLVYWQEDEAQNTDKYLSWSSRLYNYWTPYVENSPRASYFNYRDLDLGVNNPKGKTSYAQASIWGKKYIKNNFDRLVRVKTHVDPKNFFRNEQSFPPLDSYPF
ncbi:hypothetical protein ACS0TY_018663 [Phlomoides rotata]